MEWLRLAGLVLLGWGLGSLVNYLGDVLPATRRLSPPVCFSCGRQFPLPDYIFIQSCRGCNSKRNIRAWVVQFVSIIAVTWLGTAQTSRLGFWPSLAVLVYFGVVGLIDLEHRLIMHPVSLAGAILGGAIGFWLHGLKATLAGGAAGFAIMLGLYYLGYLFAKWLSKMRKETTDEEALGFGDVALSGVLGLLLGWPGILGGLVLAILLGGAGSLIVLIYSLAARKYRTFMAIPYGPFLLAAAAILLFRTAG